jgi:hypothetical protein
VCRVVLDEIAGNLPRDAIDVADFVAETNAVEFVRIFQQFRSEGGGDELGVVAQLMDHVSDGFAMLRVERLVDFIEEIERSWIAFLDGEDQSEGDEGLLTAAELIHFPHLRVAAREGDSDADTGEVVGSGNLVAFVLTGGVFRRSENQVTGTVRDELLEDLGEVVRHLPECELDRFDFAHLEVLHQFSVGGK